MAVKVAKSGGGVGRWGRQAVWGEEDSVFRFREKQYEKMGKRLEIDEGEREGDAELWAVKL